MVRRIGSLLGLGVLLAAPLLAFDIPSHRAITRSVLATFDVTVGGRSAKFSEAALTEVADANEAVDNLTSAALWYPERHFTNEQFTAASARLISHRSKIVTALKADPPNGALARQLLGEALHTLQDFYSHSNWVELGNTAEHPLFGRSIVNDPSPGLQPCPGNSSKLGPKGGGAPTSAYYIGNPFTGCGTTPSPGKCHHGNYTSLCEGINKDRDVPPGNALHWKAVNVAILSTRDYVQQILDAIADDDAAKAALLDVRGTMCFVVDDTGSMGGEIAAVKSIIQSLAQKLAADPAAAPSNWMLLRFGDPDVGTPFITTDVNALLDAVAGLTADGGGDCPELSQAALLSALEHSLPNSRVYFFSDASSKDADLKGAVLNAAKKGNKKIDYFLTGSCSPIDPVYLLGADVTGGKVFAIAEFEIQSLIPYVEAEVTASLRPIAAARLELGPVAASLEVPVDPSIAKLAISYSADGWAAVKVTRPDGSEATTVDPGVTGVSLSSGGILLVDDPAPGPWIIEAQGFGTCNVQAAGKSSLAVGNFAIVEPNPDVHGGFVAIPGQPIVGDETLIAATVLGGFAPSTFELVTSAGTPLASLNLLSGVPGGGEDQWVGPVVVPASTFRLLAREVDDDGNVIQRLSVPALVPQSVQVDLVQGAGVTVNAGSATELQFLVTNHGEAGAFTLTVSDSSGVTAGISSDRVALAPGAAALVQVTVAIPEETPEGSIFEVGLLATRSDDGGIFNGASAQIHSGPLAPPFLPGDRVEGDLFGVGDSQQASVELLAGTKLKLKFAKSKQKAKLRVRLLDPIGVEAASFVVKLGKSAVAKQIKVSRHGAHRLVVEHLSGGPTTWSVATGAKLPKKAKRQVKKLQIVPGQAPRVFEFRALATAVLTCSLKPKTGAVQDIALGLLSNSGAQIDPTTVPNATVGDSIEIAELPLAATGSYYLIFEATAAKKVKVKLVVDPQQPPKGNSVIVLP